MIHGQGGTQDAGASEHSAPLHVPQPQPPANLLGNVAYS